MKLLNKLVKLIAKIEDWCCVILLVLLAVIVNIQIITRILKISLAWPTEASILLFIFIGFLGAVIAEREREHVRVTMIDKYLSGKAAYVLRIVFCVLVVLFGIFISYQAYRLGLKQSASVTPGLGLSASIYSLPIIIAGLLIAFHGIHYLLSGKA